MSARGTTERDLAALALRARGLSLRAVAEADGRSITTLRRVFAAAGRSSVLTDTERFWAKVDKTETCWLWRSAQDSSGYGQFRREGRQRKAHRVAYEWLVGPIPAGLQLDHLCRVRTCVNPDHLEPVTGRVNVLRSPIAFPAVNAKKVTCPAGHVLGGENAFPVVLAQGRRGGCRTCQQARQARPVSCGICGREMRQDSLAKHIRARHHARSAA